MDAVGTLDEIEHKLERYSYDTKTKGQREIQPARLCGEARYELIKTTHKNSAQTHLVYELEVPEQPGEVQQAFSIAKEGQFLINGPSQAHTLKALQSFLSSSWWLTIVLYSVCFGTAYSEEPRLQLSAATSAHAVPSRCHRSTRSQQAHLPHRRKLTCRCHVASCSCGTVDASLRWLQRGREG